MARTHFFEEMAPLPRALRPRLRDRGLAGKVLCGSDFADIPYPYDHQIDDLARGELGDAWLTAVCWANAAGPYFRRAGEVASNACIGVSRSGR